MSRSGLRFSVPASGANPLDWAHLDRATLGDSVLADEVLRLFLEQAAEFAIMVRSQPDNVSHLAHRLKGSARGIGAWNVADAAEMLEVALSARSNTKPALMAVLAEIVAAHEAIDAHLRKT